MQITSLANKILLKDFIIYDVSNLNLFGFVNIVAMETCMGGNIPFGQISASRKFVYNIQDR